MSTPAGEADPSDLRRLARESGVRLDGLAVSKPAPVYPSEAREAGAAGTAGTYHVRFDAPGAARRAAVKVE